MKKNHLRAVLLIILLALAVRFVHMLQLEASPLSVCLMGDEITQQRWAEKVAAGQFEQFIPFFRAPLYGFFLGAITLLGGELHAVRFVQMLLGTGSVLLAVLIGFECFSAPVALMAGFFPCMRQLPVLRRAVSWGSLGMYRNR